MNSSPAVNPGAILLAVLLHAAIAATFLFAFQFDRPPPVITPMTIQATLTEIPDVVSAPVDPAPAPVEPEPEPEPVEETPPPPEPEPEPSVDERRLLEQQKLEEERLREEQRLEEIRKQKEEEQRQKALEEQRRREEAERRRREEEELERKRAEAERQRQAEIQRQREENERLRRQEEEEAFAAAMAAEEARTAARNSDDMAAYLFALQQKVVRNWSPPPSAQNGLDCEVLVRQTPTGEVLDARVLNCNGDSAVERSIEAAVRRASPLPVPQNSLLFEPSIRFVFRPDDD